MGRRKRYDNQQVCKVSGCDRVIGSHGAKQMCSIHYKRTRIHGHPVEKVPIGKMPAWTRMPDQCIYGGCTRKPHALNLCSTHHNRLWRLGTTELPTLQDKFWAKVKKGDPLECWEWQGSRHPAGHGYAWDGNKVSYSHVVAYNYAVGPTDQSVLHTCDNPPCCNPRHLYEGTQTENMLDKYDRNPIYKKARIKYAREIAEHKKRQAEITVSRFATDADLYR